MFQPQIRVLCEGGTEIVPGSGTRAAGRGGAEADLIYHDRKVLAKGHLTSALWRAIDPEGDPEGRLDVDAEAGGIPRRSGVVDGDALPEKDRSRFFAAGRANGVRSHLFGSRAGSGLG